MAYYRKAVTECSQHRVDLCGKNKKYVLYKQDEAKEKKDRFISIPDSIKEIIREWGEMKGIKTEE